MGFGWQTQDLNPEGACGDATDADAQRGREIIEHAARGFMELPREIASFPLMSLRERKADLAARHFRGLCQRLPARGMLRRSRRRPS